MEKFQYTPEYESPDVFLSYSHDDKEVVEKIAAILSEAGFTCWIDTERLRLNDEYNAEIYNAISDCIVFIAFLSKSYVNKIFCPREFEWAMEKNKNIVSIRLDDVDDETNRAAGYMFSFQPGRTDPAYGRDVSSAEIQRMIADQIIEYTAMQELKHYYSTKNEADLPKITIPQQNFAQLCLYHKKQFSRDGNYVLSVIRSELFPAIKDVEKETLYKDNEKSASSLISYLADTGVKDAGKGHLLLVGEGGMGKTVTMLRTCEYLLSKEKYAVYIPLSKIDTETTIETYIRETVCGGVETKWKALKSAMTLECGGEPSFYLLLDGINEIPYESLKRTVINIKEKYMNAYANVRVVLTSRWFDPEIMRVLRNEVTLLEMQPLTPEIIRGYIDSIGLPEVNDQKILSVINTPLLLTLYTDVEKYREKYEETESIKLIKNPDTPGKILSNFFQTQLFRAAEEEKFDRTAHLVLLEYMLPAIAYFMTRKKSQNMVISEDEILEIADSIEEKTERFLWYRKDRLRKMMKSACKVDSDSLLALAENSLHFLHKTDDGYSFLHQSFRDYFAAYHISNEMWAFDKKNERIDEVSAVLEEACFDDYILSFVSDQVREEEAMPRKDGDGWVFPGKTDVSPSRCSTAERLLCLWRDKEGDKAQNAVYNLFSVMRIGRQGKLYYCDFSSLDFRKCFLGKNAFVEWENDNIYPSVFDGAWINLGAFVSDGHDAPVTALCADGEKLIFSGDENGTVKVFDIDAHKCIRTLEFYNESVVDLAWHSKTGRLAVMYKNAVYLYSYDDKTYETVKNESRYGDFRYVGFDGDGELTVAYSLEPLMIRNPSGQTVSPVPEGFQFDVPARCAKWNPKRTEFTRSRLFQSVSSAVLIEGEGWRIHPAFKKYLDAASGIEPEDHFKAKKAVERSGTDKSYFCTRFINRVNKTRDLFLVQCGRNLYIYNERQKKVVFKRSFTCDLGTIHVSQDMITVELESVSVVFRPDLSLYDAYLRLKDYGATAKNGISSMTYSEDGSKLLIGIQKQILELETENFTVIRQKEFLSAIGAVAYCGNKAVVSCVSKIFVLDEEFSVETEFERSNTEEIKFYADDYEGNGCYILTSFGTFKKLNRKLEVQRQRFTGAQKKFIWAKDKRNNKTVVLFLKKSGYSHGAVFDFERDEFSEPLWNYELLENSFYDDEENAYYVLGSQLLSYERTPPFRKLTFKNYSGISIYGCSFKNIRGDISEPDGMNFIRQNGGITDE